MNLITVHDTRQLTTPTFSHSRLLSVILYRPVEHLASTNITAIQTSARRYPARVRFSQ